PTKNVEKKITKNNVKGIRQRQIGAQDLQSKKERPQLKNFIPMATQ
ncbi:19406_t:CDS:1, partial [Gigaspora rosea]